MASATTKGMMTGVTIPVTRSNARPENPLANKSTGEQLVILRERTERLTAENTDLKRRIGDKDDRAAETQKLLSAAQARNAKSMEQLAVEQAEKKLVEQNFARADAEAGQLRAQLSPLQTRTDRAEAAAAQLQAQLEAITRQHEACNVALEDTREQLRLAKERAARADAALEEVRADASRRHTEAKEHADLLVAQRDEARQALLQREQEVVAAQSDGQGSAEVIRRLTDQAEAERATLRMLLEQAQEAIERLHEQKAEEALLREKAQGHAATAYAEKELLKELSNRFQEQLMEERGAGRSARAAVEADLKKAAAAAEALRAELAVSQAKASALEGENKTLSERLSLRDAEAYTSAQQRSVLEMEYRELSDRLRRQEEELARERHNGAQLAEEKARGAALQQQRDKAEEKHMRLQEQLATTLEKLHASEERRRAADAGMADIKAKAEATATWEARCRDAERDKHKASEALRAATEEARAAGEREQVLLHRIALREKVAAVDWRRGSDVIQELRGARASLEAGAAVAGAGGGGGALSPATIGASSPVAR